jgi:type II secretory pathway predicted ATPase ExeA/septal ring-binding cell division protein DamX
MNQLTTQYWHFYGMNTDPFSEKADVEPCYLSLPWKQYIEFLSDLDNYKNALVLVTGVTGVGKTTLLHQLTGVISKSIHCEMLHGKDCCGAEQLLELLQEKLNAPIEKDINLNIYDKANQQLTYLQQTNKRYLLIVDDADALPLDVQQILLHLVQQQLQGHVVLQIIFTGKPELLELMRQIASQYKAEESKHIVNNLVLDPLGYNETLAYLNYRFELAGLHNGQAPLTDDDFAYIFEKSDGIPAEINTLTQSLLKGYFMEQHHSDEVQKTPLLKRYVWWVAVIAIIAILLIWVLPALQSHSSSDIKPISLPITKPQVEQQNDMSANPNPDYSQHNPKNRYQHLQNTDQNPLKMQTQAAPAQAQQAPAPAMPAATKPAQQNTGQNPSKMQTQTTQAQQTPAPAMPAATKPVQLNAATPSITVPAKLQIGKVAVAKPKMNLHRVTASAPAKPELTAVERELLKINPDYYTIQLFGTHNRADAIKFLQEFHLQNEAVYFHTYYNDKHWYVVISGDYPSYEQAKQALQQLPMKLRHLKPWVRNFASVRKSIRLSP